MVGHNVGRSQRVRVRDLKFIAAIFGVFLLTAPVSPQTENSDLRRLLAKQGFTGGLRAKEGVTFTELGHMACGSKSLRVVLYDWTDPRRGIQFPHESFRLIFIDKGVYLGSYGVNDRPAKVGRDFIRFPFRAEDGNRFECKAGELPKQAWLDGENPGLFK